MTTALVARERPQGNRPKQAHLQTQFPDPVDGPLGDTGRGPKSDDGQVRVLQGEGLVRFGSEIKSRDGAVVTTLNSNAFVKLRP